MRDLATSRDLASHVRSFLTEDRGHFLYAECWGLTSGCGKSKKLVPNPLSSYCRC
jgi:hypothetical protein